MNPNPKIPPPLPKGQSVIPEGQVLGPLNDPTVMIVNGQTVRFLEEKVVREKKGTTFGLILLTTSIVAELLIGLQIAIINSAIVSKPVGSGGLILIMILVVFWGFSFSLCTGVACLGYSKTSLRDPWLLLIFGLPVIIFFGAIYLASPLMIFLPEISSQLSAALIGFLIVAGPYFALILGSNVAIVSYWIEKKQRSKPVVPVLPLSGHGHLML